ncbi:MAG: exo-alpha-sialidase [Lachnospiraceae bacterium]|nr:exo-alpha-sialidase [Lachnospiraceae bacterium]
MKFRHNAGRLVTIMGSIMMACSTLTGTGIHAQAAVDYAAAVPEGITITESVPENLRSDNLYAILDGVKVPSPRYENGANVSIWSNYNAAQAGERTARITIDYADYLARLSNNDSPEGEAVRAYDAMTLYFYVDTYSTELPETIALEVQQSRYGEKRTVSLTCDDAHGIRSEGNYIHSIRYTFDAPTPVYSMTLSVTAKEGKKRAKHSVGISEISLEEGGNTFVAGKNWGTEYIEAGSEETVQQDNGKCNAFDGDAATIWHSDFKGASEGERYITMQLMTDEDIALYRNHPDTHPVAVSQLRYLPRQEQGKSNNGKIECYRILTSTDNSNWKVVAEGRWNNDNEWKIVDFPATKASYLRLEGVTTYGTKKNTYISASEIRFVLTGETLTGSAEDPSPDTQQDISANKERNLSEMNLFYNGDTTGSKFFRIPFLYTTANGTVIAGSDANFGSTGDSAENIDAAIRIKKNATGYDTEEGWGDAFVPDALHFEDYTDTTGYRKQSASLIDGVIYEDTVYTNRTCILIDAWVWNGGLFSNMNVAANGSITNSTMRSVAYGDGFCTIEGKKYLLLSDKNNVGSDGVNNNTKRADFNYVADIYGETDRNGRYRIYNLSGTPKEYLTNGQKVNDSNLSLGLLTDYTLSSEFELYKGGVMQTIRQKSSDSTYTNKTVPMKIFYRDSALQMYNTSYLLQVYTEDDGATWHTDTIVSGMVKPENTRHFITGPGRGIQLKNGAHAGRILVPVYCAVNNVPGVNASSATCVIYSDDGGMNWECGSFIPTTNGISEAALVEMPDGSVKIFVRNTAWSGGRYIGATSTDGGKSWRDVWTVMGDNEAGVNCQISAINLSQEVADPRDPSKTYPAILMTSAADRGRKNGTVYVGLIKQNGYYADGLPCYRIEWEYRHELTNAQTLFAYSCMTELADGSIGILYETSDDGTWPSGLQFMRYRELQLEGILPR